MVTCALYKVARFGYCGWSHCGDKHKKQNFNVSDTVAKQSYSTVQ